MADEQQQPAPPAGGGSQSRGAAVPPQQPPEAANVLIQGEGAQAGDSGLTPDEERQLGDLLDKRSRAEEEAGAVELKVEEPHAEMTHASVTVGRDWTRVPARLVTAIETAAAAAGVKLTRKE